MSLIAVLLFICISPCFSANYYVSPTGSDTAVGSIDNPFKTITKAATMVLPGDTVFVAEGTYTEHNIIPKSSGTQNAMIVFKAETGTTGVTLKHPGTSISDNTPIFQLSNRSYIRIDGFQFKDFKYGKASIYISSAQGNVIINNRFENLGNSEVGSWDGNQMLALFNSSQNMVCNNYFNNITGDGINVNSQRSNKNLICNNTFINFKGKLRSWGGDYRYSRAIDVQDMSNGNNVIAFNSAENVIHHIWLDRDGSTNVILRNYGKTGSGMVFNESRCANNIIQENISVDMKVGFMTAYYETTGWTFDPRWINNVAYKNETGFSVHKSMRDEFRNNIAFNNTSYNLKFTSEALSNKPHVFKNNLWYTSNKTNSIEFKGRAVSVPAFQSGVGETGGLSVNPMFTSIVSGSEDFTLQAGSPAKGAADNGLDIGAYAVYPKTEYGWNPNLQTTGVQVYFEQIIASAKRGTTVQVHLKLTHAAPLTISANIVAVAGDAVAGDDFDITNPAVTFQPGETSKVVTIELKGRATFDELLAFRIENVVNAQQGARNLYVLILEKTMELTANAGLDQTIIDSDNSGNEDVQLDGSPSSSPNEPIVTYIWSINNTKVATGTTPVINLPLGSHSITLTVTDSGGDTASDEVIVNIIKDTGVWLEAECGVVGSLWDTETDNDASNGKYLTIKSGNNSNDNAPANAPGLLTYTFDISKSDTYTLFARVICPNANDDSFWLKMDNGAFSMWNNIGPATSWQWFAFSNTYNLGAGSHKMTIGYREDGAKIDKLWITNNGSAPDDIGSEAGNCKTYVENYHLAENIEIYPNPVNDKLNISLNCSTVDIYIYNVTGNLLYSFSRNTESTTIDMSGYNKGIYLVKVAGQKQSIIKKITKQ